MPVVILDGADACLPGNVRLKQCHDSLLFRAAPLPVDVSDHGACPVDEENDNSVLTENNVAVILGYYDGDVHVAEQLRSIFGQSHQALHVFISDDQSPTPFSVDTLGFDAEQLMKLSVRYHAENVGFAHNFLNMLVSIDDEFDYFAFSDQDDIWYPQKLERAIESISSVSSEMPALYCARTEISDDRCSDALGFSPLFNKPPSFKNALIQSIGGGNTMVFNRAAKEIIVKCSHGATITSHDWWCYQIVAGTGGRVVYDPEPCLKYRNHGRNLAGENITWAARLSRIRGLLQGQFRTWNDTNLKALSECRHSLTAENRQILNDFMGARQSRLLKRLWLFKRSGIYRQTLLGNLGLLLGILLNKV